MHPALSVNVYTSIIQANKHNSNSWIHMYCVLYRFALRSVVVVAVYDDSSEEQRQQQHADTFIRHSHTHTHSYEQTISFNVIHLQPLHVLLDEFHRKYFLFVFAMCLSLVSPVFRFFFAHLCCRLRHLLALVCGCKISIKFNKYRETTDKRNKLPMAKFSYFNIRRWVLIVEIGPYVVFEIDRWRS